MQKCWDTTPQTIIYKCLVYNTTHAETPEMSETIMQKCLKLSCRNVGIQHHKLSCRNVLHTTPQTIMYKCWYTTPHMLKLSCTNVCIQHHKLSFRNILHTTPQTIIYKCLHTTPQTVIQKCLAYNTTNGVAYLKWRSAKSPQA